METTFDYPELRELPLPGDCQLLPGERLAHVGRTADGQIVASSTYRLFVLELCADGAGGAVRLQLRFCQPLACIQRLGVTEAVRLRLGFALQARQLSLAFACLPDSTNWADRLDPGKAGRHAAAGQVGAAIRAEMVGALNYRCEFTSDDLAAEMTRLGMDDPALWRLSGVNADYSVCASYPGHHVIPQSVSDEELKAAGRFRAQGRFPSCVWRCRATGAVLARASQPMIGILGWRSEQDEKLLREIGGCGTAGGKLLISDARSYRNALANRTRGGGFENSGYYDNAEVAFLGLPNLHAVRQSFFALLQRSLTPEAVSTELPGAHLTELERSDWLQLVSALLGHASRLAAALAVEGRSVLVHCSDGWDRTPQLTCLTLLLCDPHYRSLAGFRTLVNREWLEFGHQFATRCQRWSREPNEWSPVFVQFLDCARQLVAQFPTEFEITEPLLRRLAVHAYSGLFEATACDSARERGERKVRDRALCLWQLAELHGARNAFYQPSAPRDVVGSDGGPAPLVPAVGISSLRLWTELYADFDQLNGDGSGAFLLTMPTTPPPRESGAAVRGAESVTVAAGAGERLLDWDGLAVKIEPWQSEFCRLTAQLEHSRLRRSQLECQLLAAAASSDDVAPARRLSSLTGLSPSSSSPSDLPSMELISAKDVRACFVHWVPDHQRSHCADCGVPFSTLRRRHHCRACGDIFCHSCCRDFVHLPDQMLLELSRVCRLCAKKGSAVDALPSVTSAASAAAAAVIGPPVLTAASSDSRICVKS